MKKVYEPLPMLMNGRYAVLYGKLTPEQQEQVLSRMSELIEAEKEYEDKGNYGHLSNILPTIALDEMFQKNGKSADESYELLSSHMWAALTPEAFQKMSKLPFFLSVMKKIIPLGFKYGSGKGGSMPGTRTIPKIITILKRWSACTSTSSPSMACWSVSALCSAIVISSTTGIFTT